MGAIPYQIEKDKTQKTQKGKGNLEKSKCQTHRQFWGF